MIKILEYNGFWASEVQQYGKQHYVEISQCTPLGEDWWTIIWFDGTKKGFIAGVIDVANKYDSQNRTANFWIDDTHNIFAFINDNGKDDIWIEIHYELYFNEEIVGDIVVLSTDGLNNNELTSAIKEIVDMYFTS